MGLFKGFPPSVWATAFATLVAFMGIGVVDPILPLIGRAMGASPAQVEWLFTSYIGIMAVAMLLSGVVATRLGGKRTLTLGLAMVVVFSTLSGLSPSIPVLALFRAGWGLGNAFFTSTALSIIVGLSAGGMGPAITLYEAALGLGVASGPLLGGFLGSMSWRDPFFGTASLMAIGVILTTTLVREPPRREPPRTARDLWRALGHGPVRTNALIGLSYSFGFFVILAYSPLTLRNLSAAALGVTYFAWGLLVAVSSVVVVNLLLRRFHPLAILTVDLICLWGVMLAMGTVQGLVLLLWIVVTGFFCGIANALFTTLAMEISPYPRSISSAAYNFLRWAGAAVAPVLSGIVGQRLGLTVPFFMAAAVLAVGIAALLMQQGRLRQALAEQLGSGPEPHLARE